MKIDEVIRLYDKANAFPSKVDISYLRNNFDPIIKEQKALFGSKSVNYFIRFMEAKKRWRRLPDYFIKQVIENSEKI